jgi:hypothetical protein
MTDPAPNPPARIVTAVKIAALGLLPAAAFSALMGLLFRRDAVVMPVFAAAWVLCAALVYRAAARRPALRRRLGVPDVDFADRPPAPAGAARRLLRWLGAAAFIAFLAATVLRLVMAHEAFFAGWLRQAHYALAAAALAIGWFPHFFAVVGQLSGRKAMQGFFVAVIGGLGLVVVVFAVWGSTGGRGADAFTRVGRWFGGMEQGARAHEEWDLTDEGIHRLDGETLKVLDAFAQKTEKDKGVIRAYFFYGAFPNDTAWNMIKNQAVIRFRSHLQAYVRESDRRREGCFVLTEVDFYNQPPKSNSLHKQLKITDNMPWENGLFLRLEDQTGAELHSAWVPIWQYVSPASGYTGESAITGAIRTLLGEKPKTVYLVSGHGERLWHVDMKTRAVNRFVGMLESNFFIVKPLELYRVDDVPPDCDVMAVIGPTMSYLADDLEKIDRWLRRKGGSLLIALDPIGDLRNRGQKRTGLEDLLSGFGITARTDVVVLQERPDGIKFDRETRIYKSAFARNSMARPIIAPLEAADVNLDFFFAGALDIDAGKAAVAKVRVQWLLEPSAGPEGWKTWGESDPHIARDGDFRQEFAHYKEPTPEQRDKGEGDIPENELSIALMAEPFDQRPDGPRARGPRIVLFMDSDFLADEWVQQNEANLDLAYNSVKWLAGEEETIPIRLKQQRAHRITLNLATRNNLLLLLCVCLLPVTFVLLAMSVWVLRRNS